MIVVLSTPYIVEAGQSYAFSILGIYGAGASLSGLNGNPYISGTAFSESGGVPSSLTADLDFSITVVENACVIDQPEENDVANVATNISVGQTFTACVTGFITHIKTRFSTLNSGSFQFQMASGTETLSPEYTQVFVPDSAGDYLIQLIKPFRVEHNQTYAFSVSGFSGTGATADLVLNNTDTYSDGFAFTESGGTSNPLTGSDMNFSLLTLVCSPSVADFSFTSTELTAMFTDNSSFADSVPIRFWG